jgi:hypothetical protein
LRELFGGEPDGIVRYLAVYLVDATADLGYLPTIEVTAGFVGPCDSPGALTTPALAGLHLRPRPQANPRNQLDDRELTKASSLSVIVCLSSIFKSAAGIIWGRTVGGLIW